MNCTILIVDDEKRLREVMALFLRGEGLTVLEAQDGEEALSLFAVHSVDLVILDIMLPGISGFEVCKKIRETSDVPILFLSALGDEDYYVLGYRAGADDYIVKPFKASILAMKVRRILEKKIRSGEAAGVSPARLELYEEAFRCVADGTEVALTSKEFSLLSELLKNRERVLTREYLLETVWGYDFMGESRVVDNHIKKLRKKLGTCAGMIKTVIGVGYKLENIP